MRPGRVHPRCMAVRRGSWTSTGFGASANDAPPEKRPVGDRSPTNPWGVARSVTHCVGPGTSGESRRANFRVASLENRGSVQYRTSNVDGRGNVLTRSAAKAPPDSMLTRSTAKACHSAGRVRRRFRQRPSPREQPWGGHPRHKINAARGRVTCDRWASRRRNSERIVTRRMGLAAAAGGIGGFWRGLVRNGGLARASQVMMTPQ